MLLSNTEKRDWSKNTGQTTCGQTALGNNWSKTRESIILQLGERSHEGEAMALIFCISLYICVYIYIHIYGYVYIFTVFLSYCFHTHWSTVFHVTSNIILVLEEIWYWCRNRRTSWNFAFHSSNSFRYTRTAEGFAQQAEFEKWDMVAISRPHHILPARLQCPEY